MELNVLNSTSLGNQLTTYFAADWSQDGNIFIITENNVCILKFSYSMTNIENMFSFEKSDINVSEYYAADRTGINIDDIFYHFSQKNIYHSVLNVNIAPRVSIMNPVVIKPTSAAWSSKGLYNEVHTLLAVLSNTGNVEIFAKDRQKWVSLVNITQLYVEHLHPTWAHSLRIKTYDYDRYYKLHQDRVNEVFATSMCWSDLYRKNDVNFSYLLVCYGIGLITLWKFNSIRSAKEAFENPRLIYSCESGLQRINVVHWCSVDRDTAWIIAGDIDGRVKCWPVSKVHLPVIKMHKSIDIWTYKDIRVSRILSLNYEDSSCFIIIKGSYLVLCLMSNSAEIKCTMFLNIGNITITGIQPVKHGCFMISTTTGSLKVFEIVKSNNNLEYKVLPVNNDIKWDYHAAHGLLRSSTGVLWGVLMYPCKMTDHLILRSPIQITFCLSSKFDPGKYLISNPTRKLTNAWECLEIIRCLSAKSNTLPCSWLAKCENYDDLSLYELKIFMWISQACQEFILKKAKCRKLKSKIASTDVLEKLVLFKYRIERLTKLLDLYDKNRELTTFELSSIYLLFNAVRSFQNEKIYGMYFKDLTTNELNTLTKRLEHISLPLDLKCIWCEDNILFTQF